MTLPRLWCYPVLAIVILELILYTRGQDEATLCQKQTSCGQCIAASENCVWCTKLEFDDPNNLRSRCDLRKTLTEPGACDLGVVDVDHDITYDSDDAPKSAVTSDEKPIQLQPQEMTIKVRPNKPVKFKVIFQLAENYPVDLYYLMDLSQSMDKHKKKLAALGELIALKMRPITENFRLGFGSFVDKVAMPYVNMVEGKLKSPCDGCAAPYGFQHQLKLTSNATEFKIKVEKTPVSGNVDVPEGGFDAVVQAVACKEIGWRYPSRKLLILSTDSGYHIAGDGIDRIGWRDASRKMLIFSTDSGFHSAGDGLLAGVVKPNDLQCHLDENGRYTESTEQDYPSISQIQQLLNEKDVVLIFAVLSTQVDTYTDLSEFFTNSLTGELKNDSSNVVELIEKVYNSISSKVTLTPDSSENIKFSFKTKCGGTVMKETNECSKLKIGQRVEFDVSMEVTKCPLDKNKRRRLVTISPGGGLAEELKLNLELMCECDCESEANEIKKHKHCQKHGTLECGMCSCDTGYAGRLCECETQGNTTTLKEFDDKCRRTNTSSLCEGRGECICGECKCFPRKRGSSENWSGKYCECDDYSCDLFEDQICGGPERGTCVCGKCTCKPGYTGKACDCPIDQTSCMADNGELCNGKGQCVCGICQCDPNSAHSGPTCEDCPTCPGLCKDTKECVQCKAFQSGPLYGKPECDNCTVVQMVDELPNAEKDDIFFCQHDDDDDCKFKYTYQYGEKKDLIIKVQRTKECPDQVNILAIVLGVIGGIVLLGLILLLIWKIFTTIHDRREFAKFEKERENAKWDTGENPIYKQATSTFKNPTYAGNKG